VAFELVIFDCDGVLVDSEPIGNRVLAALLTEIGLPTSYEESVRDYLGRSVASCLEIIESRLGRSVPEDFAEVLSRRTSEAFRGELQGVPGIERALDGIALPICVASSGPQEKMRLTLGLTGLLPRFEGRMFSATDVESGKPSPDLFLHAAASLGASVDRCAVVEDSVLGVRAGRAAGMTVFGFAARSDPHALAAAGARVFRDMAVLPDLLSASS
jgi:HAD superfamily hydrolase (TIGR01509 family)